MDRNEVMLLTPPSVGNEVVEIEDASRIIRERTQSDLFCVYTTGGWQGTLAQIQLMLSLQNSKSFMVLGLEPDEFLTAKVYSFPITTLEERMKLYKHLCPKNSLIFEVSKGVDYDELAKMLGVYRNPNCLHLASASDSPAIFDARYARAYDSKRFLPITIGNAHTADYYMGG